MFNPLEIIAAIGIILGIIANIIAIIVFFKTRKIESLIGPAKEWTIKLSITEPANKSDLKGYISGLSGNIGFFVSTLQFEGSPKVNLFLSENKVEIFPLVQPLADGNFWWVQPKPLIQQNGDFSGSIYIGEKNGKGVGVVFQVALVAVPLGSIKEGEKLKEAPFTYAVSNIVKINRVS